MSPPRRSFGPNPPGRLAAAMLRALAAELADPGRFTRAKAYARDGAVVDIEIEPGVVRAEVQGSRYDPYLTELHVAAADDARGEQGPRRAGPRSERDRRHLHVPRRRTVRGRLLQARAGQPARAGRRVDHRTRPAHPLAFGGFPRLGCRDGRRAPSPTRICSQTCSAPAGRCRRRPCCRRGCRRRCPRRRARPRRCWPTRSASSAACRSDPGAGRCPTRPAAARPWRGVGGGRPRAGAAAGGAVEPSRTASRSRRRRSLLQLPGGVERHVVHHGLLVGCHRCHFERTPGCGQNRSATSAYR